jgi:sensor domain CHASE-containing protein
MSPYTDRVTECTSASVLCERPTDHRKPMDSSYLDYAMALGLAVLFGVVIWKFLETKADRGER